MSQHRGALFFVSVLVFSQLIALCVPGSSAQEDDPDRVRFKARFTSRWTQANFPLDYPSNATFSKIIASLSSNSDSSTQWTGGDIASDAMRHFALTGDTSLLEEALKASPDVDQIIIADPPPANSDEEITFEFDAIRSHPYLTICVRMNPSSDWFVGTSVNSLREEGEDSYWVGNSVKGLFVWDGGVAMGPGYTQQTIFPRNESQPIARVRAYSFATDSAALLTLYICNNAGGECSAATSVSKVLHFGVLLGAILATLFI